MKKRVKNKCRRSAKRCKKGTVYIITHEKFIQGSITSIILGIITSTTEGTGVVISNTLKSISGLSIPSKWTMVPLLVFVLAFFMWADNNTEEWREFVKEKTGEDEAVGEAEEESEE